MADFNYTPIVQGASSLGGAVVAAISNRKAEERANKYATDAQNRANKQNIEFWNMQNEYNSPIAQMERLRAAGLNPNLIYGTGAASAVGNADAVPKAPAAKTEARDNQEAILSGVNFINAIADVKIKQAQADNLRAQNTVMVQDALLRKAQAEQAGFDLDFNKEFRGWKQNILWQTSEQARYETQRKEAEATISSITANIKDQTMKHEIERIYWDVLYAKEHYKGEDLLNQLKQKDLELRRLGINPQDHIGYRVLGRVLEQLNKNNK